MRKHRLIRRSTITLLGPMLLASALLSSSASAWESLRCGNRLVGLGDALYRVRAICGDPDHIESYVEYRTERYRVRTQCQPGSSGRQVCGDVWAERTVEVPMDRLTYDFGRSRFLNFLLFERSTLIRIESGGYGVK